MFVVEGLQHRTKGTKGTKGTFGLTLLGAAARQTDDLKHKATKGTKRFSEGSR